MKVAVRYYTRSGNTEKLANAIAEAVGAEAQSVSTPLTEKADILFLGSSLYAGNVDKSVSAFVAENAKNIGKIVNFSTAASPRSTYKKIKKLAEANGVELSEKEFFCNGSFLFMHKGRPNEEDLRKAAAFAKEVVNNL